MVVPTLFAAAMPLGWALAPRMTRHMVREDQPVEWLQVGFFAFSAVLVAVLARRWRREPRTRGIGALAWLAFALLAFIACEEVSWGQRIFGFETPELLREDNVQGEFNLHNLTWFHEVRGYLTLFVAGLGLVASRVSLLLRGGAGPLWLRTLMPSPRTTLTFAYFLCFSAALVVLGWQKTGSGPAWDLGRLTAEWAELMLSWCAFLYAYLKVCGYDLPQDQSSSSST